MCPEQFIKGFYKRGGGSFRDDLVALEADTTAAIEAHAVQSTDQDDTQNK